MPGGDRTGPMGRGPMTGRGMGICAGYTRPGYFNPVFGRGLGRGFGRRSWGRGRRFWDRDYYENPYVEPNINEEKTYLENLIKGLEEEIKTLKEKLKEISKESDK